MTSKKTFFVSAFLALLAILFFSFFIGQQFALAVPILETSNVDLGPPIPDLSPTPKDIGSVNYPQNLGSETSGGTPSSETSGGTPSGDYQLLVELPNITTVSKDSGFSKYAQTIITLIIGFSALLAVLMFMIGGFTYMTGDSIGSKAEGRGIMTNAIFGFVLLLASYIILNTINPDLLKLNLDIKPIEQSTNSNLPGRESSLDNKEGSVIIGTEKNKMAETLFGDGTTVNKADCAALTDTNCTSLRGIKNSTVFGVNLLKEGCSQTYGEGRCIFTITGGTEIGIHKPNGGHPKGEALDISKYGPMNQYIRDKIKNIEPVQSDAGPMYSFRIGGYNYNIIDESDPPHWHIGVK